MKPRVNLLLKVNHEGKCEKLIKWPGVEQTQFKKCGFEGVTVGDNGKAR